MHRFGKFCLTWCCEAIGVAQSSVRYDEPFFNQYLGFLPFGKQNRETMRFCFVRALEADLNGKRIEAGHAHGKAKVVDGDHGFIGDTFDLVGLGDTMPLLFIDGCVLHGMLLVCGDVGEILGDFSSSKGLLMYQEAFTQERKTMTHEDSF